MINEILIDENKFWSDLKLDESKRKNLRTYSLNLFKDKKIEELFNEETIKTPKEEAIIGAQYIGIISGFHSFFVKGLKDNIIVENRLNESKYLKNTNIGDTIDVMITEIDEDIFTIRGSIANIYENKAHASLKDLDENLIVKVYIKSLNPAGYDVDILHDGVTLPGFMPNTLSGINKLYDQNSILDKTFEVMIESYSKEEGTYIVSRRKYLKTLIPEALDNLRNNEIYTGRVTGTTPFGIFVEFNECLTGMIHKANVDVSWQDKLSDIKPGFEIEFYVKELIKDKIILTQILRETLWDTIKSGQVINGIVKDKKQFGVLVSLDEETVGLIHTSELEKLNRKLEPDQEIKVKVLAIDRQNRKIFLTIA